MSCMGDLAADVTITVRMRAACVLWSSKQCAKTFGDTDMAITAEALLPMAESQDATSTSACACTGEVQSCLAILVSLLPAQPRPEHDLRQM